MTIHLSLFWVAFVLGCFPVALCLLFGIVGFDDRPSFTDTLGMLVWGVIMGSCVFSVSYVVLAGLVAVFG